MEVLGVVPARGGSKSVPRKNIRRLAGEPLIAYAIREAKRSRHISRLVLSTEDEEIADLARRYGADVLFLRPPELALDNTWDLPVFQHCLAWLEMHERYRPEFVVHLRPTAPLRTVDHIDTAIEVLQGSPEADSVRSVCVAGQHPLKMWRIHEGLLVPFVPPVTAGISEAFNLPRQSLPPAYVQNGAVDVVRADVISKKNSMTGDVVKAFVMPEEDSVNIDSPLDWDLAELLMERRKAKRSPSDHGLEGEGRLTRP